MASCNVDLDSKKKQQLVGFDSAVAISQGWGVGQFSGQCLLKYHHNLGHSC